jgi:hypothetical protein
MIRMSSITAEEMIMSRMKYTALSGLIVMAAFAGAITSSRIFTVQQVKAEPGQGGRAEAQRWEYSAILGTPANHGLKFQTYTATVRIVYFQHGENFRDEAIEGKASPRDNPRTAESNAMNRAIAKLGSEGWEMIGPGRFLSMEYADALYFKRPRPY